MNRLGAGRELDDDGCRRLAETGGVQSLVGEREWLGEKGFGKEDLEAVVSHASLAWLLSNVLADFLAWFCALICARVLV